MTVYASTACLAAARDLHEILAAYRASGLRAVELGACRVEEPRDELVDRLRAEPFEFAIHNYFPPPDDEFVLNLASADPALAERSQAFVLDSLEFAARIGAPIYSVHGGFVTDAADFDGTSFVFPEPESPGAAAEALERFVAALRPIAEHAERLGVRLLVENNVCAEQHVGRVLLCGPEDFETLFAELHSPALGVLLDFGHLNVSARVLGFDRLDAVERLAPHVGAFHVHDNDGAADRHRPAEAGSWVRDVLAEPRFAGAPRVVEARFDDAVALAAHVRALEEPGPTLG